MLSYKNNSYTRKHDMLKNLPQSDYMTITFNVPEKDADQMRTIIGPAGAGKLENSGKL